MSYKQRPTLAQTRLLRILSDRPHSWYDLAESFRRKFGILDSRTIGSLIFRGWATYLSVVAISDKGSEALSVSTWIHEDDPPPPLVAQDGTDLGVTQ